MQTLLCVRKQENRLKGKGLKVINELLVVNIFLIEGINKNPFGYTA